MLVAGGIATPMALSGRDAVTIGVGLTASMRLAICASAGFVTMARIYHPRSLQASGGRRWCLWRY